MNLDWGCWASLKAIINLDIISLAIIKPFAQRL